MLPQVYCSRPAHFSDVMCTVQPITYGVTLKPTFSCCADWSLMRPLDQAPFLVASLPFMNDRERFQHAFFLVVISQICIGCPVIIVLIETKAVNHFGMLKMGEKSLDETCMLVLRFCKW